MVWEHRRQPLYSCSVDDQLLLAVHHCIRHEEDRIGFCGPERVKTRSQRFDRGDWPLDELHLELAGGIARDLHGQPSSRVLRVVEGHDATQPRDHLLQKFETLRREVRELAVNACETPSRLA